MSVLFGEKVPLPEEDHIPPEAVVKLPLNVIAALLAQTVWSGPALAVGASVIVTVIWSATARHPPLLVVISVSVTVPFPVSAVLGI
jgi:hypothetical protein